MYINVFPSVLFFRGSSRGAKPARGAAGGGKRGEGRGGRGARGAKRGPPPTAEELDKELDTYLKAR
jgi:hypothetical protein